MKWLTFVLTLLIILSTASAYSLSTKMQEYQNYVKAGDIYNAYRVDREMSNEEKKEADKFYLNWKKQKAAAELKAEKAKDKEMIPNRVAFASTYEQNMLQQGLDIYASAIGQNKTTFKIKYILTSRPLVYKLMTETNFTEKLKNMGFRKLIMTDGYNVTYDMKL